MKQSLLSFFLTCFAISSMAQQSPNGKLKIVPNQQTLTLYYQKQPVIEVETSVNTSALRKSKAKYIRADYQMLSGKKHHCTNEANEYRCGELVLRVYNDGIAFRYEYQGLKDALQPEEQTHSRRNTSLDATMDRGLREFLPIRYYRQG